MRKNALVLAPPYAVEKSLRQLGANLRLARIRRGLTLRDISQKIGTGVRAVAEAEKGKPSASIVTYAALLWALGLMQDFDLVADPTRDIEGQRLARFREHTKVVPRKGLDNDF